MAAAPIPGDGGENRGCNEEISHNVLKVHSRCTFLGEVAGNGTFRARQALKSLTHLCLRPLTKIIIELKKKPEMGLDGST